MSRKFNQLPWHIPFGIAIAVLGHLSLIVVLEGRVMLPLPPGKLSVVERDPVFVPKPEATIQKPEFGKPINPVFRIEEKAEIEKETIPIVASEDYPVIVE